MSEKSWPTVSKGVFYRGYKGAQGPSPGSRSPQDIPAPAASAQNVKGRMLYNASKPLTAQNMREPF